MSGTFWRGQGKDHIEAGTGDDIAHGNEDNDDIQGMGGNDLLFGDDGDDLLGGDGVLDSKFFSYTPLERHGSDTLYGGTGHDRIEGQGGNDFAVGGSATTHCTETAATGMRRRKERLRQP